MRDDAAVPLICPTCQNVFAGSLKASMQAITGYFAWGCFRYFSWERQPRRPCAVVPDDDRSCEWQIWRRGPPSPGGCGAGPPALSLRSKLRPARRVDTNDACIMGSRSVLLRTLVAASSAKTAGRWYGINPNLAACQWVYTLITPCLSSCHARTCARPRSPETGSQSRSKPRSYTLPAADRCRH